MRPQGHRSVGVLAALAVTGLFVGWIGLSVGGAWSVKVFDDLVTALAALVAALACFRAGRVHRGQLRRFWFLLSAATMAWTAAEVIWAVYDLVLRVAVPVPSWADLGYLSAVPLAAAALLVHPAMHSARPYQTRAIMDGIVLATALFFLSWSFVLGPLWRRSDLTSLGGLVAVAYPFGDIVVAFLVVLVLRATREGDKFALWCVLGGLAAMAVSDSTYTYMVEAGRFTTGHLMDTGWVVAYLSLALGGFGSSEEEAVKVAPAGMPASGTALVAPFLPMLVALLTLAIEVALGRALPLSDWLIALDLTLLVLARQVLFFFDEFTRAKRLRAGGAEPA